MTEGEARRALSALAYTGVLLAAVVRRAIEMATEWAMEKQARAERSAVLETPVFTTSSTMVSSFITWPHRDESQRLLEYRAYVELALILARKLDDVLARSSSRFADDALACQLVSESGFAVPGLEDELRSRISKTAAHLTIRDGSALEEWKLGEIAEWASTSLRLFEEKLREAVPDRAEWYSSEVNRFEAEVGLGA